MKDYTTIVKWASAITILCAMVLHTLGITPWNSLLQLLGIAGWTYVAIKWNERALLLNFLPQVLIIVPGLIYIMYYQ
jgi:hypothetical protein|tara:strand:+ start:72 stop:302 length:231 start_codon:yes stop_codon:yes gene_type:complete